MTDGSSHVHNLGMGAGRWRKTPVKAGEVSDPYLMTDIEVDFLGLGEYAKYDSVVVSGYKAHVFPQKCNSQDHLRMAAGCILNIAWEFTMEITVELGKPDARVRAV